MKKILSILFAVFCLTNTKAQQLNTIFPQTNGFVYAVAVDSVNNVVYIGGNFSQVGSTPRNKLAAINLTTGALYAWNPGINTGSTPMAMYVHRGALYVAGTFTAIGGQPHKFVAKYNSSQYNTAAGSLSTWNPAITTGSVVNSIAARGDKVYLGGDILLTVGTGKNFCELDTGTATPTSFNDFPDATVNSLSIDGSTLYVGGSFSHIGPMNIQFSLAKYFLAGGLTYDPTWAPNPDDVVTSVCATGGRLFVGGAFSTIQSTGDNREKIAEIDTSTGNPTGWNPGSNNTVDKLGYRNGVVYGVGNFSVLGGKLRSFIGAIDANTGIATNWNAQVNGTVENIALAQGQIFVGGTFSTVLTSQAKTDFAVFCVNPIDTTASGPDGPTTICTGVTGISYSVAPIAGATSYVWSYNGTGATINGTSNTITIDFSASATSGTLTVKGTNGCELSNTLGLEINTYTFSTNVNANSNSIACGDSVDINSFDNYSGNGTVSYSWTPSVGLNAANVYKVTSGTKITRTYTLTETSTEGCVAKDNTTITVSPYNLNTSMLNSSILCSTTDSLHVTNDYTGFGTVTYTWSPSASVSLSHGADISVNPVVTTDYTISSSASDGCFAGDQIVTVVVNPISLSAGSVSGNITCGDATQLSASNNYPGVGTLTYTWSPSTGLSNVNITNPSANPIATTDYTITLNSPEGCVSTDHTTINVNPLQVNTAGTMSAGCHGPVVLSTNANTSNPGLTYSWTPSTGLSSTTSADPTAIVGSNSSYNVTMSLPSSGCADANNSVSITLAPPNTPQICMVTVDSASTHNIVYWDKSAFANAAIDSFRIYREISTGTYGIVGTVHYNALSEFHDYGANPNVTTYRYKISALDSCGLESQVSLYHNTVFIVYSGGGQYNWNPGYTIEPATNPVGNYLLMRDDNNVGLWHQVQSTSGSQNTIADPNYSLYPNANWQVVTSWTLSCTPTLRQSNGTLGAIVKSKSNISNNRPLSVKNVENGFSIFPNPTNGNFSISFTNANTGKTSVKVISALGQEVYNETFIQSNEKHNVDLSKYENGIYLVQITTNSSTVVKRIVKN
jgi:hypothetical protein